MTLLQLDPPIPLLTREGRKVTAIMAVDYGPEYETLLLCGFDDSRELWWLDHTELRLGNNISLGRSPRGTLPDQRPGGH